MFKVRSSTQMLSLACALLASVAVSNAQAVTEYTFNFDFSSSTLPYSADLVLGGVATSTPGDYLIDQVSGTINGRSVSLLPLTNPAGTGGTGFTYYTSPNGNWWFDNILYTGTGSNAVGGSSLDTYGLGFQLANGPEVNIWGVGNSGYVYDDDYLFKTFGYSGSTPNLAITDVSLGAAPLPASLWLMVTGLLGLVGVARRHQPK